MNLANLTQLLRRQWMIVGLVLAIAATSAYLTWTSASPTYRANATLSVLPPVVNVEGVQRNPYLDIAAASNADLAQRLSIQVNGTSWRTRLRSEGFSPDYLVDTGDGTTPVLRVSVETPSAELTTTTLEAVIAGLNEELERQQDRFDIRQPSKFTIDLLDRSDGAVRIYGNRTRLTGAVIVLGAAAATIAAQWLDNFQRRRRGELGPVAASAPAPTPPSNQAPMAGANVPAPATNGGIWIPAPRPRVPDHDDPVPDARSQAAAITGDHQLEDEPWFVGDNGSPKPPAPNTTKWSKLRHPTGLEESGP